jgi:hypothetical protein
MVQASFQHFGYDRKCQTCHAPEPVFVTGLTKEVVLRNASLETGVDCLSCHATPDGGVAAARTILTAPCRPTATAALTNGQSCAVCHVAIYKDWAESRYVSQGKTCQSCHMPARHGQAGSSHLCLGGHDDGLVRSGVRMQCQQEGNELVVRVTNHATGHNFPGERHNRLLLIQVLQRKAEGQITLARQSLIKGITPFRGESSAEKIRVDETFEARFPIVDPPIVAEVQLLYKRFPWLPDREALVVHREEVAIRPAKLEEEEEPPKARKGTEK